ncbi:MAG: preprotein translocase subunit SecE [Aggregatilineales bacterium]
MTAEQVEENSRRRRRRGNADGDMEEETDEERGLSEAKGRITPGRRNRAAVQEDGNFITRPLRGIFEYFDGVRDELRKVTWPTREELRRLTGIVALVTVISSLILGAIAFAFTELFVLGFENEMVFVVAGAITVVGYFAFQRYLKNSENLPY